MKFLIASDSFKDSLSAYEVGLAAEQGIKKAMPDAEVMIAPMADGGEGTLEALLHNGLQDAGLVEVQVHNPQMKSVTAKYIIFEKDNKKTAFIESAQSSGLMLIPRDERNPMVMNTYGLGEVIKDALNRGIRDFFISLGGSATNDGGLGMLQALGWRLYNEKGKEIPASGNPLLHIHDFADGDVPLEVKASRFTIISDVTNRFYGKRGAAFVFAKQKGASDDEIVQLDKGLQKLAQVFENHYGIDVQKIDGTGAAGGLGGAIVAALNGKIVSGVDAVIQLIQLERKIEQADVVITGEGSLDGQSVMGKVPVGVARYAKKHGKKVFAIAGRIDTDLTEINKYLDAAFSIQTECRSLQEALQPDVAAVQISVTVEQIVRLLMTCR